VTTGAAVALGDFGVNEENTLNGIGIRAAIKVAATEQIPMSTSAFITTSRLHPGQ
jgi:hypothetical protein